MEPLKAVNHPLRVLPSAIDAVYARTLGHPYFASFSMRELVNAADILSLSNIDDQFVETHWSLVAERLGEEKFAAEWNQATDGEREVLGFVAQNLPMSQGKRSASALASRLVNKGLLIKQRRGQYALYHPLFAEYVRSHKMDR